MTDNLTRRVEDLEKAFEDLQRVVDEQHGADKWFDKRIGDLEDALESLRGKVKLLRRDLSAEQDWRVEVAEQDHDRRIKDLEAAFDRLEGWEVGLSARLDRLERVTKGCSDVAEVGTDRRPEEGEAANLEANHVAIVDAIRRHGREPLCVTENDRRWAAWVIDLQKANERDHADAARWRRISAAFQQEVE